MRYLPCNNERLKSTTTFGNSCLDSRVYPDVRSICSGKKHTQSVRTITTCVLQVVLIAATVSGIYAQPSFPTESEGAFAKIEVQGATLVVDYGPASRAVLTDGKSSRARISVQSDTLHVTCPAPCGENAPVTVRVTAPRLSAIRVNNGGKVEIGQGFPTAPALTIAIRGGGIIDAAALRADSVTTGISGGGFATVSPIRSLNTDIRGGGKVRYFGDPQLLTRTQGGGTVERVGGVQTKAMQSR